MFHKSKKSWLRIRKMVIYKNDVQMVYTGLGSKKKKHKTGGKKKCETMSRKSLAKLAFYAQNTQIEFTHMITLTYPSEYPKDGRVSKGHLNRFLSWLRGKLKGVKYLWFLEFQRRGAPHYHILVDRSVGLKKGVVSTRWYDAVGSGDKKHLRAGTRTEKLRTIDGAAKYVSKYTAKREQKAVPGNYRNCGAFWGCSRGVKPKPKGEINLRGMTGEDLQRFMKEMGWEYHESLTKPLKTLYNASQLFDDIV